MRVGTKLVWGAALAAPVAAVVAKAPAPTRQPGPGSVESLVEEARRSQLAGRALADRAVAGVADAFPTFSAWHLWETPEAALAGHRGWSHQYNTILLKVLRGLGFEARLVHAARVRGFGRPWWLAGHSWVKVTLDAREYDACASSLGGTVGNVKFVPLTPELPVRRITRWAVAGALIPFVTVEVWRSWLTGRSVPERLYHPRRAE